MGIPIFIEQFSDKLKSYLGATTNPYHEVKVKGTLAAAGNYAAEDVLCWTVTSANALAWRFPNAVKHKGGSAAIVKASLALGITAQVPRITWYLFSAEPTSERGDNLVNVAPSLADLDFYIDKITLPASDDLGGMSTTTATPNTTGNLPLSFTCGGNSRDLYVMVVLQDAFENETPNQVIHMKMGIVPLENW